MYVDCGKDRHHSSLKDACKGEPYLEVVHIGRFFEAAVDPTVLNQDNIDATRLQIGQDKELYVTIALSELTPETGWFIFLEGSHQRPMDTHLWTKRIIRLVPGDAVIWRGNLVSTQTGGGGLFLTLVFRQE